MAIRVRKVRIWRNPALIGVAGVLMLGWLWPAPAEWPGALAAGFGLGCMVGLGEWWRHSRRIVRRARPRAANRIFVTFLSGLEPIVAVAVAHPIALLVGVGLIVVAGVVDLLSGHRVAVSLAAFGLGAALGKGIPALRYEARYGPLYLEYDTRAWAGVEGMRFERGVVTEALAPVGRISVLGESWEAAAADGQHVEAGAQIEVIDVRGLRAYVDRVDRD